MQLAHPIQRPKNILSQYSSADASKNNTILLKYFPKYYNTLSAQYQVFRKGPSLRKIKCVKKIDSFSFRFVPQGKKHLPLQLLQNKRRQLKKFPEINTFIVPYFPNLVTLTFNLDDRRAWKGFLSIRNIKSLNLQYGIFLKKSNRIKGLEVRFWTHLSKLRSLEHLNLNIARNLDENMYWFMNELDTLHSLLESLKTLNLQFSLSREYKIYTRNWNFKNISKYATAVEIFDETALSLNHFLTHIDTFVSLKELKIEILRTTFQENYMPLDFSPFQGLESLTKLKSLFLAVSLDSKKCLSNFLQNLTLPESLTDINLEMTSIKWDTLISDIEAVTWKEQNPFEMNSVCIDFYEKWSVLKKLTSLTLAFSDIDGYFVPGAYFMAPLLRKVSNLTLLDYSSFYGLEPGGKKCLHMDYFWRMIDHLKPTLKTLIVNDFAISVKDFNPKENEIPNLRSLSMSGFILGDTNIGSIMRIFNNHPQQEEPIIYDLHLGQVIIDNNKTWSLFLESLKKNARRNITVDLDIDIRKLEVGLLLEDLLIFVNEAKRAHGIFLYINNLSGADDKPLNDLKAALTEKPVFEALQMRTREGTVLLDFQKEDGKRQDKKDIATLIQQAMDEEMPFEPVEQFAEDDMNVVWEDEEEEGNANGGGEGEDGFNLGNFFGVEDFREIEEDF